MPRLTRILNDQELGNLVSMVLSPNKAKELEDFLRQPGELGYKDYKIHFRRFSHNGVSTEDALVQIWRQSRFLGWVENKRIIRMLEAQIIKHRVRHNAEVDYEPDSLGWGTDGAGPKNDFILLRFYGFSGK